MKIATVAQMRAMDQRAIEAFGIPENLLMENAGLAAYRVLRDRFPVVDRRILVLCGSGNNGGDGHQYLRSGCSGIGCCHGASILQQPPRDRFITQHQSSHLRSDPLAVV